MDRDIALNIVADLTATKNALQLWATCSAPTEPDSNRSIPGDAQIATMEAEPAEAPEEAPVEEPETRTKK